MFDALLTVPVIVKVLSSLALILVANLFGAHLLIAIGLGTLALAFWSGHAPGTVLAISWEKLISADNLFLMLIIFQVIWLSSLMEHAGIMRDLVDAVRRRFSHRTAIAMLPAVIGLLPMPGGALFSAPLVQSCDVDGKLRPTLKTKINYWFRHVWEYWWPLYPGVLLAMEITRLDVWQVILYGIPFTLASWALGYVFLLRRVPAPEHDACLQQEALPGGLPMFSLISPIVLVILAYAVVRLGYAGIQGNWSGLPEMNRYLPMVIGLFIAMFDVQRCRPQPWSTWKGIILNKKTVMLAAMVAALQVYGAFINADLPGGTPLMAVMDEELTCWGIPLMAVIMIIPFVSGLTTGLAVGFVGASFPIVFSLLGANPSFGTVLSTAALAYGCGYIGMTLSPVHICLIVTNEHFQTKLHRSLPGLVKPVVGLLAVVLLVHLAIRWLAG